MTEKEVAFLVPNTSHRAIHVLLLTNTGLIIAGKNVF
jgi:hypothetical protein